MVDGCTNGAGGLDDGGSADGGRCGHPRFIENDCDDDYDTMMMMMMMMMMMTMMMKMMMTMMRKMMIMMMAGMMIDLKLVISHLHGTAVSFQPTAP